MGSPRSGTTFTGEALGLGRQVVDIGEAPAWKSMIPSLLSSGDDIAKVRRILRRSARFGQAGNQRWLEQTPETSFVVDLVAEAFPEAQFVHLVRDGRDVCASLMVRGWLANSNQGAAVVDASGNTGDDAGQPYGDYTRFWVEPERAQQFAGATEATRCAWAWRRYESAASNALAQLPPERSLTIRYEDLVQEPRPVALLLGEALGLEQSQAFLQPFLSAKPSSIGNHQRLTAQDLADIYTEAGDLLDQLGYQ